MIESTAQLREAARHMRHPKTPPLRGGKRSPGGCHLTDRHRSRGRYREDRLNDMPSTRPVALLPATATPPTSVRASCSMTRRRRRRRWPTAPGDQGARKRSGGRTTVIEVPVIPTATSGRKELRSTRAPDGHPAKAPDEKLAKFRLPPSSAPAFVSGPERAPRRRRSGVPDQAGLLADFRARPSNSEALRLRPSSMARSPEWNGRSGGAGNAGA